MDLFIGIDDTDNSTSRGTGFLSRRLASLIGEKRLGNVTGITRHQLLFDERIPYTSQNSSACLALSGDRPDEIKKLCRDFLLGEAAEGSDAGLCIASGDQIKESVIRWGNRAKKEILGMEEALHIASGENIFLEGLTGERTGIIGALAATGLRKGGNDGRFIWLSGKKELRDILPGHYLVEELIRIYNFDAVLNLAGENLQKNNSVYLGDWVRPLLKDGKVTLLVDKGKQYDWEVASKEYIRTIS